jgi:hypothetical protein
MCFNDQHFHVQIKHLGVFAHIALYLLLDSKGLIHHTGETIATI